MISSSVRRGGRSREEGRGGRLPGGWSSDAKAGTCKIDVRFFLISSVLLDFVGSSRFRERAGVNCGAQLEVK